MAKPLSRDLSLCRQTYAAFFGGHSHSFSSSVYVLSMQISLPSKGGREISVINLYVVFFFFWQGKYGDRKEKGKERQWSLLHGKHIASAAYFTLLIFIIAN